MTDSRNFSLDEFDEEFDPLEDVEDDLEEGDASDLPPASSTPEPQAAPADGRSAEERTADLLKAMAPRRKVLLGILAFCEEPQLVDDVNAKVDELQAHNFSVYTAADLTALLERAGALEHVTDEGGSFEDVEEQEPEVIEVDGVEYLEVKQSAPTRWATTAAGLAAVEADRPLDRLNTLFAEDETYLPIYKRVLTLCAANEGATIKALGDAVDKDPLVQKPRLYVAHFVDKLEKCDAVEWVGSWTTTEVGRTGLEILKDVEDAPATEEE